MTELAKYKNAMRCLIEATHSVSALVNVPVETLIIAMLAAVKREDADILLEASKFFAPLRMPSKPKQGESLVPTSAQYEQDVYKRQGHCSSTRCSACHPRGQCE